MFTHILIPVLPVLVITVVVAVVSVITLICIPVLKLRKLALLLNGNRDWVILCTTHNRALAFILGSRCVYLVLFPVHAHLC